MSTKHTPGPWDASYRDGGARIMAGSITLANILQGGHAGSLAEQYANARLIAAAPELLAALRELLELHRPTRAKQRTIEARDAAIASAVAAIDKAEGV